jgi:hypothetical protein
MLGRALISSFPDLDAIGLSVLHDAMCLRRVWWTVLLSVFSVRYLRTYAPIAPRRFEFLDPGRKVVVLVRWLVKLQVDKVRSSVLVQR